MAKRVIPKNEFRKLLKGKECPGFLNAYEAFCYYYRNQQRKDFSAKDFGHSCDYIMSGIQWIKTSQGTKYWGQRNVEWLDKCIELGIVVHPNLLLLKKLRNEK